MKDIIEVLQSIAEIDHFTRHPHRDAKNEELSFPPIIVWRYKLPTSEIADFVERAVGAFPGTMEWDFIAQDRNWILKPTRIREYEESVGVFGDLAAAEGLQATDPDFGIRANAELRLLAEHIRHNLDRTRVNTPSFVR